MNSSFHLSGHFFPHLIWSCYCRLIMLIENFEIPKTNESVCQPQFLNCCAWLIFHGSAQTNQPTEFFLFFLLPHSHKRQKQKPNWSHFFIHKFVRWIICFIASIPVHCSVHTKKTRLCPRNGTLFYHIFLDFFFLLIRSKIVRNFKRTYWYWANVEKNKKLKIEINK